MSFDYSTLITNRTRSDSDTLKTLLSKPMAEWTAEERTAFNGAVMRGSYDYTDLNRVDACLEDLVARLGRVGCNVPGYERLKIERAVTPSSRLPEGYTEVQYIQSTGAQYCDSGFNPKSTSRIVMDFEFTKNGVASPFMSRDIQKDSNMFGVFNINGRLRSDFGSEKKSFSTSLSPLKRMIYDRNQNVCTIGSKTILNAAASFSAPRPVFLLASNDNGEADYFTNGKCYSCQIYDNGTLIRDFVPCINPTEAVGLYDLVGQKFYGNAGTGSFTAGPVVTWDAPEEPTETLDPYTWYESDVPVPSLLARYRANVAAVRSALRLPEGTPGVPETMRRLTTAEANSIEMILLTLNFILNHIPAAVRHCGVTVCGSKGVRA